LVFYIGERKKKQARNRKSGTGFAPASPTPRRPRRTIPVFYIGERKKKQARKTNERMKNFFDFLYQNCIILRKMLVFFVQSIAAIRLEK